MPFVLFLQGSHNKAASSQNNGYMLGATIGRQQNWATSNSSMPTSINLPTLSFHSSPTMMSGPGPA